MLPGPLPSPGPKCLGWIAQHGHLKPIPTCSQAWTPARPCVGGLRYIGSPAPQAQPGTWPLRVTSKFYCIHEKLPVALLVPDQIQSLPPTTHHLQAPAPPCTSWRLHLFSAQGPLRQSSLPDPQQPQLTRIHEDTMLSLCLLFTVCVPTQCQPRAHSCIPGPRTMPSTWQVPSKCLQDQPISDNLCRMTGPLARHLRLSASAAKSPLFAPAKPGSG